MRTRKLIDKDPNSTKKQLLRKTSTVYLKELLSKRLHSNSDDDFDENEELAFDGDYILKKALLQNHDLKALKSKEMKYVLINSCEKHLGQQEESRQLIDVYNKPEVKEVTEEEINSHLMNFMRELRLQSDIKSVIFTLESAQQNIEKLCPFGSMIRILYKEENEPD